MRQFFRCVCCDLDYNYIKYKFIQIVRWEHAFIVSPLFPYQFLSQRLARARSSVLINFVLFFYLAKKLKINIID